MQSKITKKDVLWGYLAQFFNLGANLLLLPFVLKLLPEEILGVWYIFLMIGGFAQMLDFGFQSTFSRNVAYIFSGATRLQAKGIDPNAPLLDHPNFNLLKTIIQTMQRFYGIVAIIQIILLLTLGSWYVDSQINHLENSNEIFYAWFIYILSVILGFFYSYYNSLLIGKGAMKEYNQLTIITKVVTLLTSAIGLVCGYGLMAIAFSNLLSCVINRILAYRFFHTKELKQDLRNAQQEPINLLPIVWVNARKIGLGSIGSFFIQKGNVFFISLFLPLNVVASFGLTSQIIGILAGISPLYLNNHIPDLFRSRINNNTTEIKRIFGESLFVFYLLFACGALTILFGGNLVLELLHSQTKLLPFIPLLLMLLIQFLETNHGLAATLITTRNEIPYVKAALISGACIGLLSTSSLAYTTLGVTGVILSTGIVQLCYNNWRWPFFVSRELNTSYPAFLKMGFISLKAWFLRHYHKSSLS